MSFYNSAFTRLKLYVLQTCRQSQHIAATALCADVHLVHDTEIVAGSTYAGRSCEDIKLFMARRPLSPTRSFFEFFKLLRSSSAIWVLLL